MSVSHAFPRKNATKKAIDYQILKIFQSTHSLARMRHGSSYVARKDNLFQSTHSLTRMRLPTYNINGFTSAFQSTHSLARMRPIGNNGPGSLRHISIHALPRKNATLERVYEYYQRAEFQSTHSLARMRQQSLPKIPSNPVNFLSLLYPSSLKNSTFIFPPHHILP